MGSLLYLFQRRARHNGLETLLVLGHFAVYGVLVGAILPGWESVAFVMLHQAAFGVFAGSIFAPGHKGMPMLATDETLDYCRRRL